MNQTVSVIMSVYKEPVEAVIVSVNSILLQTFKNWELIIVLDCPKNLDVKNYLTNLSNDHKNIHLIENEKNLGLGASLNKAVSAAKGEYCARMDVEDRSFSNRIEKQVSHFNKNKSTDLLFSQWCEVYSNGVTKKREPRSTDVQNIEKNFFIKSILLHPTLVIRTEILKKHNYPDMERPEDWVLFLDLICQGYRFDIVEEILYEYFVDSKKKYQKVRTYSKNLIPHLFSNIPNYYLNLYFWIYFLRIICEYVISRNEYVYLKFSNHLAGIWKKFFK